MTDIKQDVVEALVDELFEKNNLTYMVEWNEFLLTHEASIYKKSTDKYGRIAMKLVSNGVGHSKDLAVADAESKL